MAGLFLILYCMAALGVGLALGNVAKARWDGLMPRWSPAAVLVPGLLPIAWHFRRISDFIAPVSAVTARSEAASELEMLALALPFTVVAIWGLAILLARRVPASALVFPALATWLYLTGMAWAAPQVGEVIDARPDWLSPLVASQVPITVAVAAILWAGLGRAGLFHPWPLRAR